MNYNRIVIVGRVGQDPELKAIASGSKVCSFSLATSRVWKDKDGEQQEETEWHNVVFWNKPAEIIAQYVRKGSLLLVSGRVQTRTYENKDGVKMYRTEIMGEEFQLPPKSMSGGGERERSDFDESAPRAKSSKKSSKSSSDEIEYGDAEDVNPNDIPF